MNREAFGERRRSSEVGGDVRAEVTYRPITLGLQILQCINAFLLPAAQTRVSALLQANT
jgi:hypothetical protein